MFEDYDTNRTSSVGSASSVGSNEAVLFLHPVKYTLDREELQAYLNGSIYDYNFADNEIVPEEPNKEDAEYQKLAQSMRNYASNNDITIDEGLIQSSVSLAYRDKKQIAKLKKEAENTTADGATNDKKSFLSRMFTRNSAVQGTRQSQTQAEQPQPAEL